MLSRDYYRNLAIPTWTQQYSDRPRSIMRKLVRCRGEPSASKLAKGFACTLCTRRTSTDLYDAQDERAVLEIVLEAEVDLADVLARLRIIDVHVHQRDRPALEKCFLQHTRSRSRLLEWPLPSRPGNGRFIASLPLLPLIRIIPAEISRPGQECGEWTEMREGGRATWFPKRDVVSHPQRSDDSRTISLISGDVSQLSSWSHHCSKCEIC